jgi:hypothetical protein
MRRGVSTWAIWSLVTLSVCVLGACGGARSGGIQEELRSAFARVNPRIAYVRVIDVRPSPDFDLPDGDEYIVLATAGAPNPSDSIRFENELFGVFVADSSLGHVRRVLDVFPTKRWHDYSLRFETTPEGNLEVVGAGETFGDVASHRVYDWSPKGAAHPLLREYVASSDTGNGQD